MIIIDFTSFPRKVPIKKLNLKTFSDLVANLWSSFNSLSRDCTRIDIVFDLYKDDSIKACERSRRRGSLSGIPTSVARPSQPLPVDIDTFWYLSSNKVSFQQFNQCTIKDFSDNKLVYLGGCHIDDDSACVKSFSSIARN